MGYRKSFNLVTLQLIIPLSTMTKAEYKNAYGIDLDDIDIERVTLLQEDGSKNKYFVDEIKTTESGVDIYAGGNILSIGSSVSVVKNAYSVDNAKPIYFHPIATDIKKGDTLVGRFTLEILNNNPNAYESMEDLISDVRSWGLDEVTLNVNGAIKDSTGTIILSALFITPSSVTYYGVYTTGTLNSGYTDSSLLYAGFNDLVNKIN